MSPHATAPGQAWRLGLLLLSLLLRAAFAQVPPAAPSIFHDAARGTTPILESTQQPRLTNWTNDDERRPRNYDMQPPVIPHRVDGYQVNRDFNKCLDCHARERTGFSGAVPVSPTHYINRAGTVLPTISTRRYFCMQCHVAQEPVRPLVHNDFQNADALMRRQQPSGLADGKR